MDLGLPLTASANGETRSSGRHLASNPPASVTTPLDEVRTIDRAAEHLLERLAADLERRQTVRPLFLEPLLDGCRLSGLLILFLADWTPGQDRQRTAGLLGLAQAGQNQHAVAFDRPAAPVPIGAASSNLV